MNGLLNILKLSGDDYGAIVTSVKECGDLETLKELQEHENCDVYKLACAIIDKYFSSSDVSGHGCEGTSHACFSFSGYFILLLLYFVIPKLCM